MRLQNFAKALILAARQQKRSIDRNRPGLVYLTLCVAHGI